METKSFLEIKTCLTTKMFECIQEMKFRVRDSRGKLSDVQRMYGVVLGMRIALMELNKLHGQEVYSFAGHLGIDQLIRDEFGQKNLKEVREYVFPEF